MVNNDPKQTAATANKQQLRLRYILGGLGTSLGTALEGNVKLAPATCNIPETKFVECSGKAFNTIPPNDYTFFEKLNALIQEEPADALDPELTGQIAAIGIVKG